MRSRHIFVETCKLILLLHLTHTEEVTRDLANFRSIGYMPDQVALEIRQMQNGNSQGNYGSYANAFAKLKSGDETIKKIMLRTKHLKIKSTGERETDTQVIDFEELVNKVKDKLKDEFNENKKDSKQNDRHGRKKDLQNNPNIDTGKDISLSLKNMYKSNVNQEDDVSGPREAWKQFMTSTFPTTVVVTDFKPRHVRVPMKKWKKKVHGNDEIFELADLTNAKDSYEDYITPKREKIYASDTEIETRNPHLQNEGNPTESYQKNEDLYETNENYKDNEHDSKETYHENKDPLRNTNLPKAVDLIAGRTDKLRKIRKLDDPVNIKEEFDPYETEKPVENTEKAMFVKLGGDSDSEIRKMKGTMIPTREFYKMSSPNYFGKLPAVAEKYDFNEPLPDKDREPENIKYFFNPPARINKKVRLQSNSEDE